MVIKLCLQLWIKIGGDHGDQVVFTIMDQNCW